MAQRQHLEVKRDAGPRQRSEGLEERNQHVYHREERLSVTTGKFNGANEYALFSRRTRTVIELAQKKLTTSTGTSSSRWRSGGMRMSKTFRR